jgi:carboxyl-terminal processing protease
MQDTKSGASGANKKFKVSGPDAVNAANGKDEAAKQKMGPATKLILGAAVGFSLFCVGVGVGDGRIHFQARGGQNGDLPTSLDYTSVNQLYKAIRNDYDGKLDSNKLLDGLKEGLAEAAGDPYTEYFTPAKAKAFSDQLNGTGFSGIGAELGLDKDKNLIVVAPISGTPAATAGLKPQDIIAEIDGKSTTGLSVDDAVTKIRGKKGTQVKLQLIRNRAEAINVAITRDDIKIPSVETKVLDGNVGYMHISTFGDTTGDLAATEAKSLVDKNVTSIVLDLRGNPGGAVDSAIKVASLWLPQGKLIMQEKRGNDVQQTYKSDGGDIFKGLPTIVLMDKGSASASEIVAGALHDNNVAKLFGEKSYGKGVVQAVEPLQDGGQLKVTVARWYRPNGQNIDKKGIDPDKKLTISDEDAKAGNDTQLEAARSELAK